MTRQLLSVRTNADSLAKALEEYTRLLPRTVYKACDVWARRTSNAARTKARSKTKSKEVVDGVSGEAKFIGGDRAMAIVRSATQLGTFFERGTGIHGPSKKPITAKGASYVTPFGRATRSVLRWKTDRTTYTDKKGKQHKLHGYMYAPSVKGMRAKPWFYPTVLAAVDRFGEQLADAIKALSQRVMAKISRRPTR